jgi:small subunit ribosomal protein S3
MAVERKFIQDAIAKYGISKYLEKELDKAGFAKLEIQKTPMVTRIAVGVTAPGRVIGKKGRTIAQLTDSIKAEFGVDNPQISVIELENQSLEPRLIAKRACRYIEMGKRVRAIVHSLLREIMEAGALGAEITASGKIAPKGGRAKRFRVAAGYLPKAGEPARLVASAHVTAYPKSGAIGVLVKIVLPGTEFPDKKIAGPIEIPKVISAAEAIIAPEEAGKARERRRKEEPDRAAGVV